MAVLHKVVDRPLNAICIIAAVLGGLQAFQWTATSPGDNVTTYLNAGEDLQLLWNFTLSDGEHLSTVQWFYRGLAPETPIAIAMPRGGFVAMTPYAGRVDYRPMAGLVLRGWSAGAGGAPVAENGSYAVEVAVLAAGGSYGTYRRSVTAQFSGQASGGVDLGRLLRLEDRVRLLEASVLSLGNNLSSHLTARIETPDFAMSSAPCADGGHSVLNQSWRHVHNGYGNNCDNYLVPGWYRFIFNGVPAFITTRCPISRQCGTYYGMWLDMQGQEMPNVGQEVIARAFGVGGPDCHLKQNRTVTVKNCGAFYVYKLQPSLECSSAYCITTVL